MKVAAYGLTVHKNTLFFLNEMYQIVQKENIEVTLYQEFQEILCQQSDFPMSHFPTFSSYDDLNEQAPDAMITFGGDGTILNAVTYVRDLEIPIIGINTGRLGFLASINRRDFLQQIEDFLCNRYLKSERTLLELVSPSAIDCPIALNDFAIARKETTSMITVDTYLDDEFLNSFWADGLIISTPTGSTGYSLSTGGPIISPDNQSFVITPIAPHNLNVRPLIFSDQTEIKLKVKSRVDKFSLSLDSRLYSIPTEQELTIRKAPYKIILAQSLDYNYYRTLREKLNWGYDLRN